MQPHPTLDALDDLDAYRRLFTDVSLWTPSVRAVCQRHKLAPCRVIRTGVPGTCPTFIVDDRWVVKFFGRLFDGADAFAAEREAARLVSLDPAIRAAKVAASGYLRNEDWPWPYLVYEYIPGTSIGEAVSIPLEDRLLAARVLGETVNRIHALPLDGSAVFPNSHEPHLRFLAAQHAEVTARQREWGSLPQRLVDQIETYLPPVGELAELTRTPHLIHADLTRDHLLGRIENGRWTSLALIDFGDARTGGLFYELAALHLDLFGADPRLLAAFFETYHLPDEARRDFPRKALAAALLHQFNVFAGLPAETFQVDTLAGLAARLYG